MGFSDGVIRMVCVDIRGRRILLIQVIKSHSAPVTTLALNASGSILVSGSEDKTIFVHQIVQHKPYMKIIPIGLVKMPSTVAAMDWNPDFVIILFIYRRCSWLRYNFSIIQLFSARPFLSDAKVVK